MPNLRLILSPERMVEINQMADLCGMDRVEFFNNALTLMQWAIGHVQQGRPIAAIDEPNKKYFEVTMEIFARIKPMV